MGYRILTEQQTPQTDQPETQPPAESGTAQRSWRKTPLPDEVRQEVREIATKLGETQTGPFNQFTAITIARGIEFVREVYEETLRVEAGGGIMTNDNKRRRTPGGVFFYLARGRLTHDERARIFGAGVRGQPVSTTAHMPEFTWDEWPAILASLADKPGRAQRVNVQIMGRPVQVDEHEGYIAVQIVHTSNYPSMPRGVPEMTIGDRPYTVYCTPEQWAAVKEALDDPEEYLVVDGKPGLAAGDVRIYAATFLTSKMYQADAARRREAEKQDRQAQKAQKAARSPERGADKASKTPPKPKAKPTRTPVDPAPAVPALADMEIPDGLPPEAAQKLRELMASASVFRQKIDRIESQPEGQRFGLDMTRKLLQNVENEIDALLARHT